MTAYILTCSTTISDPTGIHSLGSIHKVTVSELRHVKRAFKSSFKLKTKDGRKTF